MSNPAYPTLPIQPDSKRVPRDGRQEDITGDGIGRVRKLYADRFDFEVHHPMLTADQFTTLQTFYDTYPLDAIDLTWPEDGIVYTVRFGSGGIRTQYMALGYRDTWVRLIAG